MSAPKGGSHVALHRIDDGPGLFVRDRDAIAVAMDFQGAFLDACSVEGSDEGL